MKICNQDDQASSPNVDICPSPDDIFTANDMLFLQHRQSQITCYVKQELVTFYSRNPEVFHNLITAIYFRTNLPYSTVRIVFGASDHFVGNFFLGVSDMDDICESDKRILVEKNAYLFNITMQSIVLGNVADDIFSFGNHMWLVGCPNPSKIEQCLECTSLIFYTHLKTK